MKFKTFKRNLKAISPVISVLLMIAVAVVASLVAYAWVMGYIGSQTGRAGQAITIQATNIDTSGDLTVYVQNVGSGAAEISTVYINGTLVDFTADPTDKMVLEGNTIELKVDGFYTLTDLMKIKVVTVNGQFMETNRP